MHTWKQLRKVKRFLCNSYIRSVKQFHRENELKTNEKNAWQFIQHNYENGSTMTQKKVLKWKVHLEIKEKRYRNHVLQVYQNSGTVHKENVWKTIEKCVLHNVITTMGCQWLKRKQRKWRVHFKMMSENCREML